MKRLPAAAQRRSAGTLWLPDVKAEQLGCCPPRPFCKHCTGSGFTPLHKAKCSGGLNEAHCWLGEEGVHVLLEHTDSIKFLRSFVNFLSVAVDPLRREGSKSPGIRSRFLFRA